MLVKDLYKDQNLYHVIFADIKDFVRDMIGIGESLDLNKVHYTLWKSIDHKFDEFIGQNSKYSEPLFQLLDPELSVLEQEPKEFPFYTIEMTYDGHTVSRMHFK